MVSTSGGPLEGAEIFVFDASTGDYVLSALSVADGSYSFDLPANASYKLFIQPHEAGYSDQWHGGPDFAGATAILLDTDKTEDVSLAPTPPPTSLTLTAWSAPAVDRSRAPRSSSSTRALATMSLSALSVADGSYVLRPTGGRELQAVHPAP